MRVCEVVWDVETADRVEAVIGSACQGRCPFVPDLSAEDEAALEAAV